MTRSTYISTYYSPGKFVKDWWGRVAYYPDPKAQKDITSIWWWKYKRAYKHMQDELNHYWSHAYDEL